MVLIQLLLPTSFSKGTTSQAAAAELSDTRRELAERFDGLTAISDRPRAVLQRA